ncbi:16S rRNA (guanine(1516)-N(2))-methyltransferase [Mergibacter septicus]|uniref:Ribosomal RNA small subunit methyltransferase J n=1 Tax=Mergibacter septicus TaxID=221402 RepID=A0A8E3S8N0_9PAST|nr:class I SAM-dependent methyltransferase [Mergibacter septicus]AWX15419.1 16S rRNA (guanine(1516)-N(2))-methyltransferase [Mergibacter septicus]QDJ14672.1 16S rRNA (guanine(1516)-N(2))-methyltransferase [Mergibacter septicus]UTU47897.1 class I SAM-dependent methyltransferase [Mergibacter septicus]WMR96497.1 class I SAM-dependent methyltransferase [Mergibacter septicus]
MQIQLVNQGRDPQQFEELTQRWQLLHDPKARLALVFSVDCLALYQLDQPKQGAVYVDFVTGVMAHRRKFGGGRGEAVAKAVGIKQGYLPTVLDATAGLGRDAFVLASIGCQVDLIERNSVVSALLADGLQRAYQDPEIGGFMQERMRLLPFSTIMALQAEQGKKLYDVVYLDPMYPHKQKSALVKKEMRVFQHLVGADLDADLLLEPALNLARKRVVVKRPDYAPFLAEKKPSFSHTTKNHRFDIYLT